MTTHTDWPVAFFDDDYLKLYRPTFRPERTAQETEFIATALALAPDAAVLDLACGFGRHAIAMAQRGYRVTGVDFNPRYLELAAEEASAAGAHVTWHVGDMRALGFDARFDALYSYFTSFGYFSDEENEQVLVEIARALKVGGRFLIDMANRDWILTHSAQRTWNRRADGALWMEEVSLDLVTSRVTSRQLLIDPKGGPQVSKEFVLRAYTCAELAALLRRHGLELRAVWGGPEQEPYSSESRRLVMLSERVR